MNQLLVQKYLETNSLKQLELEHGVFSSFNKSGQIFNLNYSQISSKDTDKLSQQCRSLILACEDGRLLGQDRLDIVIGKTIVVSRAFDRFFNFGQGEAANIDLNDKDTVIYEKIDGSIVSIFYNQFTNQWLASSRSVPEADLLMDNKVFTFRTLFEKALFETSQLTFDQFTSLLDKNHTYIFELVSPLNQIIVKNTDYKVYLLGIRDLITMEEIDPILFKDKLPVPQPRTYSCANVNELIELVGSWQPSEHEGVVVRDKNFNRIKIKNPAYCLANKFRDSLASERNIMELILLNKEDDIISLMPQEIVDNILILKNGLQTIIKQYNQIYNDVSKSTTNQKDFAIKVNAIQGIWAAPFFDMRKNNHSFKDFIETNKKMGSWGDSFIDKMLNICKVM